MASDTIILYDGAGLYNEFDCLPIIEISYSGTKAEVHFSFGSK